MRAARPTHYGLEQQRIKEGGKTGSVKVERRLRILQPVEQRQKFFDALVASGAKQIGGPKSLLDCRVGVPTSQLRL